MAALHRLIAAACLVVPTVFPPCLRAEEPASTPAQVYKLLENGHPATSAGPTELSAQSVTFYGPNASQNLINIQMTPRQVMAPYVGVAVDCADRVVQSQLKLPEGVGLVVKGVEPKSPAQAAGLEENDVLTRFADQVVINPDQLEVLVRLHKAGEAVECTVIRAAQALKVMVTLGEKEQPELAWILTSRHPMFAGQAQPMTGSGTLILQVPATSTPADSHSK